jgi:outer membrane lipoprotein-sorting protein
MTLQIIVVVFLGLLLFKPSQADTARAWKSVNELTEAEQAGIDLRTDTPRDPQIPYLPAEKYPFSPPYTAEEMGYRAMEFPHMPRWSCALADWFGSITSSGFLQQGKTAGVILYVPEEGLAGYLYATSPGKEYVRWLFYDTAPPESYGNQSLMTGYRTDQTFSTRMDSFFYSPSLRRVRRMPQPRRDDRFPNNVQTMDDITGRDAWESSWRLLGTDVLYETVRFPKSRSTVTLVGTNGTFAEMPVKDFKMLGDEYPYYTAEGGVECYVVEATAREEWLPNYSTPKLIYWLDRHHFYPLRIESYDREGKLVRIEVRTARLANPNLKERGYAPMLTIYYDLTLDMMSYAFHDSYELREWSEKDRRVLFTPDFMRRGWLLAPLKVMEEIRSPEEFYLRPLLYQEKFPQDRRMELPADLGERIRAQEAAGHLVFETVVEARVP